MLKLLTILLQFTKDFFTRRNFFLAQLNHLQISYVLWDKNSTNENIISITLTKHKSKLFRLYQAI